MLADQVDYVIGVDTHRDQHALAVVDAHDGRGDRAAIAATNARGYATRSLHGRYAPATSLGDR